MPTVSIIIPVYKVEPYIERCIQSVMAQTYTNIECILVNDCTPDDSVLKCQKLINSYSGPIEFKILHHKHNRGLSAARNSGTNAATGEYIYYLDSDDEITPNCISLLTKETELHPGVELVQGGVKAIPHNSWFDLSYYQHPCHVSGNDWIRFNFFKSGEELPAMAWNKLIRKDFLVTNRITFKEGLIHEDELWSLQIIKKLNNISIVGQPTYLYYKTSNSIMSTTSRKRSAQNMIYVCRIGLRELDNPYKQLQLYKYLWILLDRLDDVYKTKEAVKSVISSIFAIISSGHTRLALRLTKKYFHYIASGKNNLHNLKEDIACRWEIETNNSTLHIQP